ncbi:hypothetical protein HK102_013677, partial [Quaeritorhiza haematococci]
TSLSSAPPPYENELLETYLNNTIERCDKSKDTLDALESFSILDRITVITDALNQIQTQVGRISNYMVEYGYEKQLPDSFVVPTQCKLLEYSYWLFICEHILTMGTTCTQVPEAGSLGKLDAHHEKNDQFATAEGQPSSPYADLELTRSHRNNSMDINEEQSNISRFDDPPSPTLESFGISSYALDLLQGKGGWNVKPFCNRHERATEARLLLSSEPAREASHPLSR